MSPANGDVRLRRHLPGRHVPPQQRGAASPGSARRRRAGSSPSRRGRPSLRPGCPAGLGAATPVFSPDGKHVAFNDYTNGPALARRDGLHAGTNTFANKVNLHTPTGNPDLFPAFLPTNDAVVFEHETANDGEFGATRDGTRGELWWVDLATQTAAPLATLNGVGYLPTSGTNHTAGRDAQLRADGQPGRRPAATRGSSSRAGASTATSRRIDPFLERSAQLRPQHDRPTTKKLWVAAIDLNAQAGHRPEPPGVLPAGAGAPRGQLARLLGRRPVRAERRRRA